MPRVLLFSPAFFGYERSISSALEALGCEVDFFDERPSNGSYARAILRLAPWLLRGQMERHFESISKQTLSKEYDFVIVIKGEVIPRAFLTQLREANKSARFVFYSFDSIANSPRCLKLLPLFDRKYSFDFEDARGGHGLDYMPLFYGPEFSMSDKPLERRFEASFVGTLHSGRYQYVRELLKEVERSFLFFYVPARWYYYVSRLGSRSFRGVRRADISFDKLTRSEVADVFRKSRVVFDMQREGQSGLTMRTFEALASGAILATTNPYITEAPFFDSERIVVVPEDDPRAGAAKIEAVLRNQTEARLPIGFDRYALSEWAKRLLE